MRFTPFTGQKKPIKHGKNAKVAKSTRVCPPTFPPFQSLRSKLVSERRSSLQFKEAKLIPIRIPCDTESAVRIASEWRCAILLNRRELDRKSKFLYRYRPEGIFQIFFGLILDPPGTYAFTAKKGKFICTGHFFPHGMAF